MATNPPWETLKTLAASMAEVNLFLAATSHQGLQEGWEKVKSNNGCAGSDGISIAQFQKRAKQRLDGLRKRLRSASYTPEPLRLIDIPKANAATRRLAIPTVTDRIAQTAVAQSLMPLIEAELADESFAYRPGRSVQKAVDRIEDCRNQGFTHLLETDIDNFFDSIPHHRLMTRLEILFAGKPGTNELLTLIGLWLEATGTDLASPGKGVGQGSPLSPMLANLYLDSVDEALRQDKRFRLVRFADDLVILTKARSAAELARDNIDDLLAEHGLALNIEKTRVSDFNKGFHFLGHLFVKSMVLKARKQDREDQDDIDDLLRWIARRDHQQAEKSDAEDRRRAAGLDPGLRTLHILQSGRTLEARNRAFTVIDTQKGRTKELLAVPATTIDRIEIGPGAFMHQAALDLAILSGTIIHHTDGHGATRATTIPASSQHAALHLDQSRTTLDPARRLELARMIIDARLRNQRALLRRLNRKHRHKTAIRALTELNTLIAKLTRAESTDQLMGFEGAAARLYWPNLAAIASPKWASTSPFKRQRHPAPDPLNLVLNYTAHLLARDLETLIHRHGLHPGFATLHASRDRTHALAFDLMEELRAPVSEALTIYLFNNRILGQQAFHRSGDGHCQLKPLGHQPIIQNYHRWLERPIKSKRRNTKITWRRMIEDQIINYARHCRGEETYTPYIMDY